jgi:hypothetical protein
MEGQFDPIRVDAIFYTFISPFSMSLLARKHFIEVENEVILLPNNWIWY